MQRNSSIVYGTIVLVPAPYLHNSRCMWRLCFLFLSFVVVGFDGGIVTTVSLGPLVTIISWTPGEVGKGSNSSAFLLSLSRSQTHRSAPHMLSASNRLVSPSNTTALIMIQIPTASEVSSFFRAVESNGYVVSTNTETQSAAALESIASWNLLPAFSSRELKVGFVMRSSLRY